MTARLLLTGIVIMFQLNFGWSVNVTKLDVPSVVDPRKQQVLLRCDYDLGGLDLYSVNWYRNDDVIFRYMPSANPKAQIFEKNSKVKVSSEHSNSKQIVLLGHSDFKKNKEAYEGTYVCEVSAEAPFPTAYAMANLTVAILPQSGPAIEGLRPTYQIGDVLEIECVSSPSFPASELTFLINGHKTTKASTRKLPSPSKANRIGEISRLELVMRLERSHFKAGKLTLTCQSKLPGVFPAPILKTEKSTVLFLNSHRLAQEPQPRSQKSLNGSRANYDDPRWMEFAILSIVLSTLTCKYLASNRDFLRT